MSLCGGLDYSGKMQNTLFDEHMVNLEMYQKNPKSIFNKTNLVIRDGDRYFNWATCSAITCAKIFFNERLPRTEVDKLKPTQRRQSKSWFFFGSRSSKQPAKDGTTTTTMTPPTASTPNASQLNNNNHINFGKTLTLTSDELKQLGLRYGNNEIRYEVFTALQGTGVTKALVYLWKYDDRIDCRTQNG